MEIRASKSKGAHRRAPREAFLRVDPRSSRRVHVERRVFQPELRIRLIHVDRGWQNLVVQGKGCLDQTGNTGRSLGMADLRFHAAQGHVLLLALVPGEHTFQAQKLGRIPCDRPRTMCFYEPDRFRLDTPIFVGPPQSLRLPLGQRVVDAAGPPVARGPDATDHGVDPIVVSFRILEALESDHADPFTYHHPVGILVKRSRSVLVGKGRGLAETHVHEDGIVRIDPARDHHLAPVFDQFANGRFHRRERTRTG